MWVAVGEQLPCHPRRSDERPSAPNHISTHHHRRSVHTAPVAVSTTELAQRRPSEELRSPLHGRHIQPARGTLLPFHLHITPQTCSLTPPHLGRGTCAKFGYICLGHPKPPSFLACLFFHPRGKSNGPLIDPESPLVLSVREVVAVGHRQPTPASSTNPPHLHLPATRPITRRPPRLGILPMHFSPADPFFPVDRMPRHFGS